MINNYISDLAMADKEIIFEFRRLGAYMKVTAMDPETLTEISVQGPASAGQHTLMQHARARLNYVLKQKQEK